MDTASTHVPSVQPTIPSSPAQHTPDVAAIKQLIYHERNIAFNPSGEIPQAAAAPAPPAAADDAPNADLIPAHTTTATTTSESHPVDLAWKDLTFDVPNKVKNTKPANNKKNKNNNNQTTKQQPKTTTTTTTTSATSNLIETETEPNETDAVVVVPDMTVSTASNPAHEQHHTASAAPQGLKRVLHHVSGAVRAGQFLAIMGASGAGKSTLLNLLAGRVQSSKACVTGGSVLLNQTKRDFDHFNQIACYVEQQDIMFPELTVQEQITYAALLRLPSSMTSDRKLLRVEAVIQELGLAKARNTLIGDELIKGISGGERKRVSIASELVMDASLLFLDEPTTGLDAFNALNVMMSLRHLASRGRTVISTIHQPRSSIFHLFDMLCVLSEGRTVYFGPARDASAYFANLGFRAPPHFNVADYVIDAVSIDYRSKKLEANTKHRVLYLAKEYNAFSSGSVTADEALIRSNADGGAAASPKDRKKLLGRQSQYPNNFFTEYSILFSRAFKKFMREKTVNITRLFQTIFFAVLLGIIWLSIGRHSNNRQDRYSILGVLFFLGVNQGFDGAFSVIFQFVVERAVVQRERTSGSYRTITYFLANLTLGAIKVFIVNVLFVSIVYWMVGLRASATNFFFVLLVNMTLGLTGEGFSQAISVFTGSAQIASAIVPLFVVMAFLFAGFFIPAAAMPGVVRWGQNLSFLYWGYNALAHNEFDGRKDPISASILGGLNNYSRWGNYGFTILFAIIGKSLFLAALYARRPKYDKKL